MNAMHFVEATWPGVSLATGARVPDGRERLAYSPDRLAESLSRVRGALTHVICLDPSDVLQCADYREQLDWLIDALRRSDEPVGPAAALERFDDVVRDLKRLDDDQRDAAAHAYAFARAYRTLADVAPRLPAPADGWTDIFAEADEFFVSLSLALQACGRPDQCAVPPRAH